MEHIFEPWYKLVVPRASFNSIQCTEDCQKSVIQWSISLVFLWNVRRGDLIVRLWVLARLQKDFQDLGSDFPGFQWKESQLVGSPAVKAFGDILFVSSGSFMERFCSGEGCIELVSILFQSGHIAL